VARAQAGQNTNVIVILADDLGFGDLGCYGSRIPTPNLDRMAAEGVRLNRFYSASPVCSPSRAALLTGKYPARTGIVNVLLPGDPSGLPTTETTIPKVLKERGYKTSCIGKWHLGNRPAFLPIRHGFDEFRGVPYSNDMYPLPYMNNAQVTLEQCDQESLTDRFTAQAVDFIQRQKDSPFFLYMAHTAPHIPIVPAARFKGVSGLGPYGDIVNELDWSVGQVLAAVRDNGLDERTLVIFTSDNGPWYQGSAGNLQGRKGSTFDGGVRTPFIARMPGRIPAGTTAQGISSMMDLLPTISNLCGAPTPSGIDGVDLWPMLSGREPFIERDVLLFFDNHQIQCARWGPWKLHVSRYNSFAWTTDPPGGRFNLPLPRPELYNIDADPAEGYDVAAQHPDVVASLRKRIEDLLPGLPESVQSAWRDTMSTVVEDTPAGALPRRKSN
jgi:arylsulfatase